MKIKILNNPKLFIKRKLLMMLTLLILMINLTQIFSSQKLPVFKTVKKIWVYLDNLEELQVNLDNKANIILETMKMKIIKKNLSLE